MRTFHFGFFMLLLQLLSMEKCRARFILIEMESEKTDRDIPKQPKPLTQVQPVTEAAPPTTGMIPLFHCSLWIEK